MTRARALGLRLRLVLTMRTGVAVCAGMRSVGCDAVERVAIAVAVLFVFVCARV